MWVQEFTGSTGPAPLSWRTSISSGLCMSSPKHVLFLPQAYNKAFRVFYIYWNKLLFRRYIRTTGLTSPSRYRKSLFLCQLPSGGAALPQRYSHSPLICATHPFLLMVGWPSDTRISLEIPSGLQKVQIGHHCWGHPWDYVKCGGTSWPRHWHGSLVWPWIPMQAIMPAIKCTFSLPAVIMSPECNSKMEMYFQAPCIKEKVDSSVS